ncbi:hypothetical protein K1T71_011470 [Dendrolimus kikuchii]|uniref:Uncharacterized protein n=1 Tax=Dendrolimus kikuchii TaxID=765133 RepID=A0ACC1CNW6_9NEOP|nr:hypothetical protein K1T71_011470 [Dendrolimus kikuchii]
MSTSDSNQTKSSQKTMSQQVFHPSLFNRPRSSSLSNLVQFSKTTSAETPQSEVENQLQNILRDTSSEQKPPPPWQKVPTSRSQKKRKASKSPTIGETTPIKNRYNNLPIDAADNTIVNAIPKIQKPPPIVLYGVQDVNELSKLLESACNKTDFKLKIVNKTLLRVLVDSPESYKKVITLVRDNGLIGHTFTPKNLRSYRIVIKDLHHSTPHSAIMEAIEKTGNMVRGEIINARSGPEKMPTSTFFVNLEPNPNNKAVKNIDYIFHQKVIIEDPRKSTSIVQCHRCQQYGHSKNNCMRPYRCVKCGKGHRTSDCPKKDKNTPATCALCTLDHPANYKGCLIYKEIVARRNKSYYEKSRTQNQPMFLRREVAYLGHIISDKGVSPNPDKVEAVVSYPTPRTPKHIKNFSKITKPLTSLLRKDVDFTWSHQQEEAFNSLKSMLTNAPILQYPDFSKPFILTTDASEYAIGAVLSQGEIGNDLPIAYASRTLNKAEGNYSVSEKELLGVIYGTKTFRPYLYGRKFKIVTDHKPLVYLMNCKDPSSKLLRWRLKIEDFDYEIVYKPGKLNSNADALSRPPIHNIEDIDLNDNLTYESYIRTRSSPTVFNTRITEFNQNLLESLCPYIAYPTSIDLDDSNPYCRDILNLLENRNDFENSERELHNIKISEINNKTYLHLFTKVHHYDSVTYRDIFAVLKEVRNNLVISYPQVNEISISDFDNPYDKLKFLIIYEMITYIFHDTNIKINIYHNKLVYPTPNQIPAILKDNHDSPIGGHIGSNRMYSKLKDTYYWSGMKKDIENYVRNCPLCQQNKALRATNKASMEITTTSNEPLQRIFTDIVGPLPESGPQKYKYIVTFQDDLTKYSMAYPIVQSTAEQTSECLIKFISHFGIPKTVLSDQGVHFIADVYKQVASLFKIKHLFSSPYHPQTNGALERSHSTLKEYLKSYVNDNQDNWYKYLPTALISYNSTTHSTTNFSPHELLFGCKPYLPSSIYDINPTVTYPDYIKNLKHRLINTRNIARENILRSKERSKHYYDQHTREISYNVGDMVYIKYHHRLRKALSPIWKGPYQVTAVHGNSNVTVQVNRRKIRYHFNEIKLAHDNSIPGPSRQVPSPTQD